MYFSLVWRVFRLFLHFSSRASLLAFSLVLFSINSSLYKAYSSLKQSTPDFMLCSPAHPPHTEFMVSFVSLILHDIIVTPYRIWCIHKQLFQMSPPWTLEHLNPYPQLHASAVSAGPFYPGTGQQGSKGITSKCGQ